MKNSLFLILIALAFSIKSNASFEETSRRYLTGHEIILSLQTILPLPQHCLDINTNNRSLLGVNSPLTGNPISPAPTQATIQWILKCVGSSMATLSYPYEKNYQEQLKILVGEKLYQFLITPPPYTAGSDEQMIAFKIQKKWSELSPDIQQATVRHVVQVFLGNDDMIRDFGLIDPEVLRLKLLQWPQKVPDAKILDIIKFLTVNLAVRDEFLSY